jgi:hypothetical protein
MWLIDLPRSLFDVLQKLQSVSSFRFVQTPLSEMKQTFTKRVSIADEEIKSLGKTQKYWERSAADAQGNLKDILGGPRTM